MNTTWPTPGYYPDMPWSTYLALEARSRTDLLNLAKSPSKARWFIENETEQSPAMAFGSLAHCLLLEPDLFDTRYAVLETPCLTKTGKVASSPKSTTDWAAFVEANPGKTCLLPEEAAEARAWTSIVRAKKSVGMFLNHPKGLAEVSGVAELNGHLMKARADWIVPVDDGYFLADIKTARDASPTGFVRAIAEHRYAMQAAIYSDVFSEVLDGEVLGFFFIAIEKTPPYDAGVYKIGEGAVEIGRAEYGALLERWEACEKAALWDDYSAHPRTLVLPHWYVPLGAETL